MYAYAAANLPKRWFTGVKLINLFRLKYDKIFLSHGLVGARFDMKNARIKPDSEKGSGLFYIGNLRKGSC